MYVYFPERCVKLSFVNTRVSPRLIWCLDLNTPMQERPSWEAKSSSDSQESSLPCLQHPANYTYSEPVQSAPHHLIPFIYNHFSYFRSIYGFKFQVVFSLHVSLKQYIHFSSTPCVPHSPPIFFLTSSTLCFYMTSTRHTSSHWVILSSFLSPPPPHGPKQLQLIFFVSRGSPNPTSIQNKGWNILNVFVK